jgi:mRNA interferase MazF
LERFVKGDLVVVDFPISDLTTTIRRPALVIVELDGDDRILCQITSQANDKHAIQITQNDCDDGGLNRTSNVRPSKIFTADKSLIKKRVGHLRPEMVRAVTTKIIEVLLQ